MPKKIQSFYWASDANCNELRVLRTRSNNLNSSSRIIHNFCDSFKSKTKNHFRNNSKKGKYIPIEDYRRGILNCSSKKINRKEQYKTRSKLKLSSCSPPLKKNIVSLNSLKKQHPNRMAVDFDHMYIDCGDSKISLGRDIELQHLKELSILNVEIIQQQNDEIKAKDKMIKTLQEEKKNLETRIERIERRLSLFLQKKKDLSIPISIQTNFIDDNFDFEVKTEPSPRSPRSYTNYHHPHHHTHHHQQSPISKRQEDKSTPLRVLEEESLVLSDSSFESKKELRKSPKHSSFSFISSSTSTPLSVCTLTSPREKRYLRNDSNTSPTDNIHSNGTSVSSPYLETTRKLRSPTIKKGSVDDLTLVTKKNRVNTSDILFSPSLDLEEVTDHSLRSRNKPNQKNDSALSSPPNSSQNSNYLSNHQQFIDAKEQVLYIEKSKLFPLRSKAATTVLESPRVRGEGILTTRKHYHLPLHSLSELTDSWQNDQHQVEIPQWRIKTLSALYVMEGTENLEDEIFLKRHQKPEYDERRRKRWDLQRMREQRQYEKLRERYECRNKSMNGAGGGSEISLKPPPEGASVIQVDQELPVCAFGQNLVVISETDFIAPWITEKSALPPATRKRSKK